MDKRAAGFVIYQKISNSIQYLMLQTSYGEHHWTPPKGHVDPGENDITTALRETFEESGLIKNDLKIYEGAQKIVNYNVNGTPKHVVYFLAELINKNAKIKLSEEHQNYKWLPLEEAITYGKYKEMTEVLNYFDNYIKTKLAQ